MTSLESTGKVRTPRSMTLRRSALALAVGSCGLVALTAGCGDDAPSGAPGAQVEAPVSPAERAQSSGRRIRSALRAGRASCRGRTPDEVIDAYLDRALNRTRDAQPELLDLVTERRSELRRSGRIHRDVAARVYSLSHAAAVRDAAYRGCSPQLTGGRRP